MPSGVKPENCVGNKNSGRKTLKEELRIYREKIKQITLEELAASKVYQHLEEHTKNNDRQGVKELALPVYLKSKIDKSEVKLNYKQIYDGQSIPRENKGREEEMEVERRSEKKSQPSS